VSAASDIEWTDATWNPTRGGAKGVGGCYAQALVTGRNNKEAA